MTTSNQRPVDTLRLGSVVLAIWKNETSDGRAVFNVTTERIYTDDQGNWKSNSSFRRDDLLLLAKVCDKTHDRVFELEAAEREPAGKEATAKAKSKSR